MTQAPDSFAELVAKFSLEFDERTVERHQRGLEKYGAFKWLGADLIEELKQELLDTSNYARYHFIKLCMLQAYLANDERLRSMTSGEDLQIGIDNFFGAGEFRGAEPSSDPGRVNPGD